MLVVMLSEEADGRERPFRLERHFLDQVGQEIGPFPCFGQGRQVVADPVELVVA